MNIQQLKVFVKLVELKTLKETGYTLNIRQPTVHFHIKKLEEEFQISLFKSNRRKNFSLTKEGEDFYHEAKNIVLQTEKTERMMEEYKNQNNNQLQLGSTYSPATYMLLSTFASYKKRAPNVSLSLEVKPAHIVLEKVKNFELDIGIISYDQLIDPQLIIEPLIRDDLQLLCHPNRTVAFQATLTAEELQKYPFIMHEKESLSRYFIDTWAREQNIELNQVMEVSSTETMKEAVKKDIGLAIVPQSSFSDEVNHHVLVSRSIPEFHVDRYIYVIYNKSKVVTSSMQEFLVLLQEQFNGTISTKNN